MQVWKQMAVWKIIQKHKVVGEIDFQEFPHICSLLLRNSLLLGDSEMQESNFLPVWVFNLKEMTLPGGGTRLSKEQSKELHSIMFSTIE